MDVIKEQHWNIVRAVSYLDEQGQLRESHTEQIDIGSNKATNIPLIYRFSGNDVHTYLRSTFAKTIRVLQDVFQTQPWPLFGQHHQFTGISTSSVTVRHR